MAELALAETANDNVKFDEQHDNKVAARALTSNDLLGGALQTHNLLVILEFRF